MKKHKEQLKPNIIPAPTLFVGVGGTGCKIVKKVADLCHPAEKENINFLCLDTNVNDLTDIATGKSNIYWVQTSNTQTVGSYLDFDEEARKKWFPKNAVMYDKTVSEGAGQVRAISRLALNSTIKTGKIRPLYDSIDDLFRKTGKDMKQAMRVVIASTASGGTGSGIILPLSMFIRDYVKEKYPNKKIEICPGQIDNLYQRAVAQFLREKKDVSQLKASWFETRPKLVVLGGGHVGSHVARLGHFLDFEVIVADDRAEFADAEKLFFADHVYCQAFDNVAQLFPPEENTYYVVVTRGHQADKQCVEQILNHGKYAYLGMIGSRLKVEKTLEALRESRFSEEQIQTIHAPIGLKIGARTPEEIALSIAAELVQEKNKRSDSTLTKELLETKETGVLCIITKKSGSSPRGEGSMMLVTEERILGSIGGGILEKSVIEAAKGVKQILYGAY